MYGRSKEYAEKSKVCACKQCLVMVMCSRACIELLDQAYGTEYIMAGEFDVS